MVDWCEDSQEVGCVMTRLFCSPGDSYQGQEENGGQAVRPCDVIKITGKPENCQAAKEALEKLVPVTIEVRTSSMGPVGSLWIE